MRNTTEVPVSGFAFHKRKRVAIHTVVLISIPFVEGIEQRTKETLLYRYEFKIKTKLS